LAFTCEIADTPDWEILRNDGEMTIIVPLGKSDGMPVSLAVALAT
jgi:hypothetical protein